MIRAVLEVVYDDVCDFLENLTDVAESTVCGFLYIIGLLTIPLWIVPYSIHKKRQEKEGEKENE